ncbi:ATP-binding protein [Aestuariimicrobium kwangyangense]|uniref:ATP-binding protein n=1 Tax=Aestuariimicrobium kwangyangense TaxID=396389 RepID=UPI0003B48BF7|nr:ATP-binding protein [Aestuariimicrobium kwangyangense]
MAWPIARQLAPERHLLRPTFTVLNTTRLLLAVHAVVFNVMRSDAIRHPWLVGGVGLVMLGWTGITWWTSSRESEPRGWFNCLDLAVTVGLVLSSELLLGPTTYERGYVPVTVDWHVAAPLAIAVSRGPRWGLASAALVGASTLALAPSWEPRAWSGGFAVCIIVWGVGQLVELVRAAIRERDATVARSTALAERDRVARIVHDGALQVLSMVEREGPALGPTGQRLSRMARNQETRLRAILQDRTVDIVDGDEPAMVDLVALLDAQSSDRVTVSTMAGQVMMPRGRASELMAAVSQALYNAQRHAGANAHAWVLVEELEGRVTISVRDNGVGMTPDAIATALASDRMGMRASIRGRLVDLGGTATLRSEPGRGVEWELSAPLGDPATSDIDSRK